MYTSALCRFRTRGWGSSNRSRSVSLLYPHPPSATLPCAPFHADARGIAVCPGLATHADRLKAENVPVILTSTMSAPDRQYEGYDNAYATPAKLHAAGVKFAISGGSGGLYSNRLPWEAGVAVAFGLPEEEALKAVTINAAEFMGVADKVGSLEVGKEGTLLITSGTPLDMTSNIIQSYIQGKEINMMDIQKFFFEKYMEKIKQQAPKKITP